MEMKKIFINAIVTPHDDSITLKGIQDALKHLGAVHFNFESEVELADSEGLTKEVWLYVPNDDSEPYIQVDGPGETEGLPLSEELAQGMRAHGVCVEFRAEYPNATRYGAPSYSTNDDFASCVVADHLFKVDVNGMEVSSEDRGDDGGEEIWLKLVLPE